MTDFRTIKEGRSQRAVLRQATVSLMMELLRNGILSGDAKRKAVEILSFQCPSFLWSPVLLTCVGTFEMMRYIS